MPSHRPNPFRVTLSANCILVASVAALAANLGAPSVFHAISGIALAVFFALEWARLTTGYRVVLVLVVGASGALWWTGQVSGATLFTAVTRGCFLALFLTALVFLKEAAISSPLIRRCGHALVNQPPGRRYLLMTIGGHLFGILLNVGSMNVLNTMIHKAIVGTRKAGDDTVAAVRQKRMTLAALRGFSAITTWAPTSVTMAILLSNLPHLTFVGVAPYGFAVAVAYLGLGWLLDRLLFPSPTVANTDAMSSADLARTLLPLVGLVVLVPGSALTLSELAGVHLLDALLTVTPIISMLWLAVQAKRVGPRRVPALLWRRLSTRLPHTLVNQRKELFIFATAGFGGVLLASMIDPQALEAAITRFGLSDAALLIGLSWGVVILSIIGLNPIITVTAAMSVYHQMPPLQVPVEVIALSVGLTWSVVVGLSPMTISVRVTSAIIGVPAHIISLRWNLLFSLITLGLLDAALLLFA